MLNVFDTFPNLLKSGFIGLVAIFAILLYFLFKNQFTQNLTAKQFLLKILPFIVVCILLLGMSGYSIYTNRTLEANKTIDSLQTELNIYKGSSPGTAALQEKYNIIVKKNDSLHNLILRVGYQANDRETLLNENIMLEIVESFEEATNKSSGKSDPGISQDELQTRRYKNAIFQNVYNFGADTAILKKALLVLKKRGATIDIDQLVHATPALIELKRRWIPKALLALQNAADSMSLQSQTSAEANVPYPQQVWILKTPYTVILTDDQIPRLQFEKELLDKKDL